MSAVKDNADPIDTIVGYTPSQQPSNNRKELDISKSDKEISRKEKTIISDTEENRSQSQILMDLASQNIDLLFKDQYGEGFVRILNKDHKEISPINSSKFTGFLFKLYYEHMGEVINKESINNAVYTLQAKAEFGDIQYPLSLRVAEYQGNFYYDLTDEKHRCIGILKNDGGTWHILNETPVPLFRRYNQIQQELPCSSFVEMDKDIKNKQLDDPLEIFLSKLTNIKDPGTKLLVKVALISYFIPNIPHIVLIIHGGKGSAKSTFQTLLKNVVDPAKPTLLTLHDSFSEFIQQLSHNYLATYDNMKYVPKWLSDEVCKAVTGIGQTKRILYTNDEDKIFEYKHCLNFNGINIVFSEPDVIDRSIIIELDEIDDEDRKTEEEILKEFNALRPKLLAFIFDILAKAITIKPSLNIKKLPRMADFSIWGVAISIALGYKEFEFLNAYYNNIGFQNNEVIESLPLAFVIKKLVERQSSETIIIFEGIPSELLEKLNQIAIEEKINTSDRGWPKDRKWVVKRINIIKTNLQKGLGIKISINRNTKNNTSIIKIEKNNSGNSGEHNLSPENKSLSPYFDSLSPVSNELSPEENQDLSTKPNNSGDTGDKSDNMMEGKNDVIDIN
jgi:hypothetical protein